MNLLQVDAMVQLMGAGRMSQPMRRALAAVMVDGMQQKQAAAQFGVSRAGLCQRVAVARRVIGLACTLVTGGDVDGGEIKTGTEGLACQN